ncbi:MAG: CRISPR-associated endonuclease Cas2 [Candidatus Heimdallarchaeaceae archaeon]
MKKKKIIVLYDIHENKKRNNILEICKYYGLKRIQYSVYGGILEKIKKGELEKELRKENLKEEDNIRILDLCENCITKMITLGKEKEWEKMISIKII